MDRVQLGRPRGAGTRAGRLDRNLTAQHQSNVGAGLLAKAACQTTSLPNVSPPSRASPLPHGLCSIWKVIRTRRRVPVPVG
ncbi:hypothetical protein EAH78_22295 [Pseudomonas arsenicoxydans]|uniref:Uncharacterized protein n=1 Tax=Pseudomonas arsenicoxydans TaxID=702115 RepID=A0A502HNF0_9PSED|nr:hypothetical protein EAH78_22295 [Pseudomonas arsenicoxydans]